MQGEIVGGGYPPPVGELLTLGDPRGMPTRPVTSEHPDGWPDYPQEFGLGSEDVPDLIRMATDTELNRANSDSVEGWAPLHAVRALGQLRATAAIEPLLRVLTDNTGDDWVHETLPDAFGLIGPAAGPALTEYLCDASHEFFSRVTAAISLDYIGVTHPEARAESVAALTQQIEQPAGDDAELNAFVITALIELKAVEAAPRIKAAFERGAVDVSVIGDWDSVRLALGLWPPLMRITQPRPRSDDGGVSLLTHSLLARPGAKRASDQQDTTKKAADKSHKRNKKRA